MSGWEHWPRRIAVGCKGLRLSPAGNVGCWARMVAVDVWQGTLAAARLRSSTEPDINSNIS